MSHKCSYLIHQVVACLAVFVLVQRPCSAQANETSTLASNQTVIFNNIDLSIELSPIKESGGVTYVAAHAPLNIQAKHDGLVSNETSLLYQWFTKGGPIKVDPHAKAIVYTFTQSNEDNFIQVNVTDPQTHAFGSTKVDVTVKSPVVVADPVGKLFLEKGEMLDVMMIFSGSAPFQYCYKFCYPTDIIPCTWCFISYETTDTKIPIKHYLHSVGNYTLMFQIQNIMNFEEKQYVIKINDTVRKSNLPIAPIVSSILAVCILISGVALHMRFKDTSYNTETANFDFFHDDHDEEWEQELSFIQRVRYLFCGANEDDADEENESRYLLPKGPNGRNDNR